MLENALMFLGTSKSNIGLWGWDILVGKASTSHAGDLGLNPGEGLTQLTPMHEWEGKRLPAVKVILHQLPWLTGDYWFFNN